MDIDTLSKYLDYPIQPPPPGVTPNFVNPDSKAYQIYITGGVCISLMLVFSLARFWFKIHRGQTLLDFNEIVFVAALVLCLAFIAMTIPCVYDGAFGTHAWNVLIGSFSKSQLLLSLLIQCMAPLAICLIKISILVLYWRVFHLLRWMRIASITGIILIALFHVSMSALLTGMCAPSTGTSKLDFLAAFVSEKCARTRIIVVIMGIGNVVTDLFLLILPLPAVWGLQMPLKRKLEVSCMFLVGISACIASILGLYYRVRYYTAGKDNIRLVIPLWTTAMAEDAAGVMICCMPATAALAKSIKGPVMSGLSSASGRVLRLISSRSRSVPSDSRSFKGGSTEREGSERDLNPVYCHPGPRDRHAAWVDADIDSYSLRRLKPESGGIGMKTEVQVAWAG